MRTLVALAPGAALLAVAHHTPDPQNPAQATRALSQENGS